MGLPAVVVMNNQNERLSFSVSVRRGEQRWAGHAAVIAILTETSQAAPPEDYRISFLNSGGEDFAVACMH